RKKTIEYVLSQVLLFTIGAGSSYSTKNLDLPVMILFLIIL
ncbi:MAG: hypothetical protein ACI8RD_007391, partial [Bacillariaceae sp.]